MIICSGASCEWKRTAFTKRKEQIITPARLVNFFDTTVQAGPRTAPAEQRIYSKSFVEQPKSGHVVRKELIHIYTLNMFFALALSYSEDTYYIWRARAIDRGTQSPPPHASAWDLVYFTTMEQHSIAPSQKVRRTSLSASITLKIFLFALEKVVLFSQYKTFILVFLIRPHTATRFRPYLDAATYFLYILV